MTIEGNAYRRQCKQMYETGKAESEKGLKRKTVYMCGVAFQHDFEGDGNIQTYGTIEDLGLDKNCMDECGIVEVEVTIKELRWIKKQTI